MKKHLLLIMSLALTLCVSKTKAGVLISDSLALVDIYNAAGGAGWQNQGNWLTDNVENWVGVTVDANGRVTELSLYDSLLSGVISPSIGNLTELTKLEIKGDEDARTWVDIHGTIPAELWNCTKISRLQIKFTKITGPIPAGIEAMTSLYEINTQATPFNCEIPKEIFELPSLGKAYLHESSFIGTVPSTILKVDKNQIERIYLKGNQLDSIPFIDNLPNCKLKLTGNYFSFDMVKPYHDAISNYRSFEDDYQYAKAVEDKNINLGASTTLDGAVEDAEGYAWFKNAETVPFEFTASYTIPSCNLSDEGTYTCKAQSSGISSFDIRSVYNISLNATDVVKDSLALVDIYNAAGGPGWDNQGNWLTDNVVNWNGVILNAEGRVSELSLYDASLSGVISPSIGQLTELTKLEIKGDEDKRTWIDIHGTLPAELWNCTKINRLQIKFTKITSPIPAGIEAMTSLYEINTQATPFNCEIPAELFELPSLGKAYLHESGFTGIVPATILNVNKDQIERIYLKDNELDSIPFVDSLPNCKVKLTGNYFTYDMVKPYHDAAANYKSFADDYQYAKAVEDKVVDMGGNLTLDGTVEGAEGYGWFKDDDATPIANDVTCSITDFTLGKEGTYTCKAQSSKISSFDIRTVYNVAVNATPAEKDSLILVEIYNAAGGSNWKYQNNWLTDTLSNWTGVVLNPEGRVTELSLYDTLLCGTISPAIGQLSELTKLEIKGDEDKRIWVDISGTIPAELWNCTKINRLQLKFTKLTGPIPAGIEAMDSLYEINTQATPFNCEIPEEIFELPSLGKAYLHESGFTGHVPATLLNVDKDQLERLYISDNELDSIPFIDNLPNCKIKLTGNYFSFANVKPYHDAAANSHYKKFSDDYQYAQATKHYTLDEDADTTFSITVEDGEAYNWFFNGDYESVIGNKNSYTLSNAKIENVGTYECQVQNSAISSFYIKAEFVVDSVLSSSQIDDNATIEMNVYPNPCTTSLTIISESQIVSLEVIDLSGKTVKSISGINNKDYDLSTSELANGIYFVNINCTDNNRIFKFVKK